MTFQPIFWAPNLPVEIPDILSIGDFVLSEEHGRYSLAKSRPPFVCGLSGKAPSSIVVKEQVGLLVQDARRKCTVAPHRKVRRNSDISSLQKPVPLMQKSQITRSPINSRSQSFQSILGSLRLTSGEYDLFNMLLAPQQEHQDWSTKEEEEEEEEEGKDEEIWHKFENNKDCGTSTISRIEAFHAEECQSQAAVGILQEIVDIEKAWILWNSSRS